MAVFIYRANMSISALLALCAGKSSVIGEFPLQRPVTRSFDIFFDLYLNKRLSKQSWGWWFETPSCPLWRHVNEIPQHSLRRRNEGCANSMCNTFSMINSRLWVGPIDSSHKSRNSLDKYPIMHILVTKICTHVISTSRVSITLGLPGRNVRQKWNCFMIFDGLPPGTSCQKKALRGGELR